MIRIIGAGLRGGGNLFCDDDVAAMSIDDGISGYARIVGELMEATFARPGGEVPQNP
jgi:hypothetical protein